MRNSKAMVAVAFVAFSFSVNAQQTNCPDQDYEGLYLNVSSAGYASKAEPLIVCTVVSPTVSIYHSTAFFAETNSGDAKLEVKYVDKAFPQRTALVH